MYSFYEYLAFFVIYAFLGWCAEVIFNTINTGHFVNRGFLSGPVCPIYGFGMVIVVFCLTPLQKNWMLLFFGSMFLTSALEWITGYVLKKVFHTSWWDYSNQPFNLGGYICLRFSILCNGYGLNPSGDHPICPLDSHTGRADYSGNMLVLLCL